MKHRTLLLAITAGLVVLIIAACSAEERETLRRMAALPTAAGAQLGTAVSALASGPSETPAISVLRTATPMPTMAGPMGTLTAIADLVASPTQDAAPYVIVNQGKPHFIEFHAWW